jgi:hypothetical protein
MMPTVASGCFMAVLKSGASSSLAALMIASPLPRGGDSVPTLATPAEAVDDLIVYDSYEQGTADWP